MKRTLAALFALSAVALALPAAADVIVLAAKGSALKAGDTVADSDTIDLPAGASAQLLLPSGTIKSVAGPAKITVSSLARGDKADSGLFDKVAGLVGKSGNEGNVGAVRAVVVPRAPVARPFSLTDVPVDADGAWCLEKGAAVSLARQQTDKPMSVTVTDLAATRRSDVAFEQGKARMPWPADVELKPATYGITVPDRPMRQIRVALIDKPAREDTIRVLHAERCDGQLRAFLTELKAAAN